MNYAASATAPDQVYKAASTDGGPHCQGYHTWATPDGRKTGEPWRAPLLGPGQGQAGCDRGIQLVSLL